MKAARLMRRLAVPVLLVLLLARGAPASAAGCDPNAPPDCSCGKLPVCVFSGHPDGMYSDLYAKSKDPWVWKDFGQGESDYGAAMQAESDMARALAAEYPCLEVITTDSYLARILLATEEGDATGLQDRMRQAKASGDTAALEQLKKEADAIFDKWGIGDLPWQDPELASLHMSGRLTGCIGTVKLSGVYHEGQYEINATSAVPMGGALDDTVSSAAAATPQGGLGDLAKRVADQLGLAHRELFGSCQETVKSCTGVDWELSHQTHRCEITESCNGVVMRSWTEDGEGLRAVGRSSELKSACCGEMARARGPEGDAEDREVIDQIWCPGTWNLWGGDLDCDGIRNADDPAPMPADATAGSSR